ncbi:tetratricopeptide repeat protein, partial [Chloroflexota bacterium]
MEAGMRRAFIVVSIALTLLLGAISCIPPPPYTPKPAPITESSPAATPASNLIKPSEQAQSYFKEGLLLLQQEQWDAAIAQFDKALAFNPNSAPAYANRALARLGRLESQLAGGSEYNSVISDVKRAYDLDPFIKLDVALARAYIYRGNYYFDNAKYAEAIKDYPKALELDPSVNSLIDYEDIAYAYSAQADVDLPLGQYEEVIVLLNQAQELEPEKTELYRSLQAEVYFGLGLNNFRNSGLNEAVTSFNRAIELNPYVSDYYYHRAQAYFELSENYRATGETGPETASNNLAIADFSKTIEMKKAVGVLFDFAPAYFKRGI